MASPFPIGMCNAASYASSTNTNELFDAATNYAAVEEAIGAIFDDKPNKRKEDAPAEGGNLKTHASPRNKSGGA